MRISRLLVVLALGGLAACSDPDSERQRDVSEPKTPVAAMPITGGAAMPGAPSRAPYGVVADVRYGGDPADLGAAAKVYLFLRQKGERMPIAVQYFDATELPKQVAFTGPEPLSNVELVARLSRSGRVDKSSEDAETVQWIQTTRHPPETLELVLDANAGSGTSSASGPSSEQPHSAAADTRVRVQVTLDSADDLAPDAAVFIIARDDRNPMPLAVRKLALRDLPTEVELSDSDAMLFSHRLSAARRFTLVARISATGRAERLPGDLESNIVAVDAAAIPDQVTLAIRSTAPVR